MQVLQGRWDATFSEHSHGFRPGRSAHQAVRKAQQYIAARPPLGGGPRSGEVLRSGQPRQADGGGSAAGRRQEDARVDPGVLERGCDGERAGKSRWMRARRKAARYRHCCRTSCSTNLTGNWSGASTASCGMRTTATSTFAAGGQGQRVMRSITGFITRRLKLKVNEQKSAVARPAERKFLGFSFTNAKEPKRRIAPKALLRFKQKVRELTRRTRGISHRADDEGTGQLLAWLEELLRLLRDALGAEESGSMDTAQAAIRDLEAMEAQPDALRGTAPRGVSKDLAAQTAGSSHCLWRLAQSPALSLRCPSPTSTRLDLPRLFAG